MRLINIDKAQTGMRVAQPVFSGQGNILVQKGAILTQHYITQLIWWGITSLYVFDETAPEVEVYDVIRSETRLQAVCTVKKIMTLVSLESFSDQEIMAVIGRIFDQILHSEEVMVNLIDLRTKQDYHFDHSVGVCVLSLLTGVIFKFGEELLRRLGEAAILHDLGKVFVPGDILEKPGALTPNELVEIRRHTWFGFWALDHVSSLGVEPAKVALTHHERFDGTGYPLGLKGGDIPLFARIVALADVFDALITDRVYRKRYIPYEAVEILTAETGTHFDPEISRAFLLNIAPYPVGSHVFLNTGERGVVTRVYCGNGIRPEVTVVKNAEGYFLKNPYKIDLRFVPTVFIISVIQEDSRNPSDCDLSVEGITAV